MLVVEELLHGVDGRSGKRRTNDGSRTSGWRDQRRKLLQKNLHNFDGMIWATLTKWSAWSAGVNVRQTEE